MPVVHTFHTAMRMALGATLVTVAIVTAAAGLTSVPQANPKIVGVSLPTVLSPELRQFIVAQGSIRLENGTPDFSFYGYNGDGPMVPAPGDVQAPGHNVEATKTEPDKNTYLILSGQHGPDPDYNYGTHCLFQGHESGLGTPEKGYITRINLDADGAHRVTLLASTDVVGNPLPVFDGSTWNPWAQRLLFTSENGSSGGVWQATVDFPSTVEDISGAFGRAGYEGIQNDSDGSLWIVEDVDGASGIVNANARQPNSFIYRFIPEDPKDLKAGKLQALQVLSLTSGQPIVFYAGQADHEAGARMGAGILECDVTFTSDGELVCRHDQCDLHTTTNILVTPLAAKCSQAFTPAAFDASGKRTQDASALCCTSDLTLDEFKSLKGKMDASNPNSLTAQEFQGGTPNWRTDLYATGGTLLSHKDSIQLIKSLGAKFTPELKGPNRRATLQVEDVFGSQEGYAQAMIDAYEEAGIPPKDVFAQSFNRNDILYWLQHEPSFGTQAVYLDDRYETITPPLDPNDPDTWKSTESNSPLEQSPPIVFWDNRCPSRSIAHHIRAIFAHS